MNFFIEGITRLIERYRNWRDRRYIEIIRNQEETIKIMKTGMELMARRIDLLETMHDEVTSWDEVITWERIDSWSQLIELTQKNERI